MNLLRIAKTMTTVIVWGSVCFGDSSSVILKPNGLASMECGQIVSGFDKNVTSSPNGAIHDVWTEKIITGFGLDVHLSNKTDLLSSVEIKTFNEFPRLVNYGGSRRFYYYLYLTQAEINHVFFDETDRKLKIGGGYFPYKYNDDVRNLGEYLFRSTTYPQTLTTEFDYPFARLAGMYVKGAYYSGANKLALDVLATVNTEWIAILDLNLSLLASYNLAKVFEIGAGVSFCSILSADSSATTPKDVSTAYLNGQDTMYYTFKGTKVMGRFSFDPKKLFPSAIFGDQDLKLYGEACLIGVKNYPAAIESPIWYNSILERIPVMIGFNLPAMKILDVLSVEGEWWGNRYPNSMEGIVNDGLPIPFRPEKKTIDSTQYKSDNIKWSLYLTKKFATHYHVTFQVADDHIRTFAWDWNRQDWEESLRGPGCWYYVLKFGVMF
jgi:hypothetical protein